MLPDHRPLQRSGRVRLDATLRGAKGGSQGQQGPHLGPHLPEGTGEPQREIFTRGEKWPDGHFTAITGCRGGWPFSAPSVCAHGEEDVMVMITASTYNRPSSAPSFIRGHSFPTPTLSGRTCYPPTLQMRTQGHAEGPTQQVGISQAALPWSGVGLCPSSLSPPGMHARQEAPERGSLS